VENVNSVKADQVEHTVTVAFDDEKVKLDQIIKALNDAGYTVGEPTKLD
jgi:copper chaperone CopZ